MGRARVSAVRRHDLISLPEIVRLHLGDDRVLGLPTHVVPLLGKKNGFTHGEAIDVRHETSPAALTVAAAKVAALAACAIFS